MIELNLIPDVKQELLKAQRTRALVISGSIIASIIAGGVVVLLAAYIYVFQLGRTAYLDGQIEEKNTQLSQVTDLSQMLTIQNQLARIAEINENKKIDSRIFDMVAAIVPPAPNDVQFSLVRVDTVSADSESASTIRLEGQTRSYDSMEIFKKTLDSAVIQYTDEDGQVQDVKLAQDISTGDISFGENDAGQRVVRFTISFTYPDELFSAAYATVDFKLSVNGNVTDSYLGIPKEIFTERAPDATEAQ